MISFGEPNAIFQPMTKGEKNAQKASCWHGPWIAKGVPDLIEKLKSIVLSNDFIDRHRNSPKDFTRNRTLPFHMLIFFLINMNKGSYQDELDHYFMAIHQLEVAQRFVTKGSLSKARKKLSHQAFVELNEQMVHEYYRSMPSDSWMGFNLLAIDGSTLYDSG